MEKQKWVRPQAIVQEFVANEYVAACGDSGTVYKFKCDAKSGTLYYYPDDIQINGVGSGQSKQLGGYKPCNATHEANSTDPFYDGFIDYNGNGTCEKGESVIVWLETVKAPWGDTYIRDYHATTNLNMSNWQTAKS